MMRCLKEVEIAKKESRSFHRTETDFLEQIYIPLLNSSKHYRRHTGYLTLGRLNLQLAAMVDMVASGGDVQLVVGEFTDEKVIEEIRRSREIGKKELDLLKGKLKAALESSSESLSEAFFSLAELMALGKLEIKLALITNSESGKFHQKVGIFEDACKHRVVVAGSDNETVGALRANEENVKLYFSWEESIFRSYAIEDVKYHDKIWRNEHPGVYTLSVRDSLEQIQEAMRASKKFGADFLFSFREELTDLPEFRSRNLKRIFISYLCANRFRLTDVDVSGILAKISTGSKVIESLACLYLDEIVDLEEVPILQNLELYPHQVSGLQRVIRGLLRYNTFVLADSVGLGKTRTALAVAKYMLEKGRISKVAVLAPRKLHTQWHDESLLLDFKDGEIVIVSRDRLERMGEGSGKHPRELINGAELVVIDEAHQKLVNHRNITYENTSLIAREGTYGLLLTATPMLNSVIDLYNLVNIFGNKNLGLYFATSNPRIRGLFKGSREANIDLWKRVFIQRTKHLIRKQRVAGVDEIGYADRNIFLEKTPMSEEQRGDVTFIVREVGMLRFSHYDPLSYFGLKKLSSENVLNKLKHSSYRDAIEQREKLSASLLKVGMLKLLDSSFYAISKFIHRAIERAEELTERMSRINSVEGIIRFVESALIPEELVNFSTEEGYLSISEQQQRIVNSKAIELLKELSEDKLRSSFKNLCDDLERDKSILRRISVRLEPFLIRDPQVEKLFSDIDKFLLQGKKILIFTQFTTTCRYIYAQLVEKFSERAGMVLGSKVDAPETELEKEYSEASYWGDKVTNRDSVLYLFAPEGKELRKRLNYELPKKERMKLESCNAVFESGGGIDVLIATDTLSVGQNLQDASVMIHFDLPWNPMILEQRIGRIDRPRPVGEKILIYEYILSTDALDAQLKLINILESKMQGIYSITNFDSNVIPSGSLLQAFNSKLELINSSSIDEDSELDISDSVNEIERSNQFDIELNEKMNLDEEALDRLRIFLVNSRIKCSNADYPKFTFAEYRKATIGFSGFIEYFDINGVLVETEKITGALDISTEELNVGINYLEEIVNSADFKISYSGHPNCIKETKLLDDKLHQFLDRQIEQEETSMSDVTELAQQKNRYVQLKEELTRIYINEKVRISTVITNLNELKSIFELLDDPDGLTKREKAVFAELIETPSLLFSDFHSYSQLLLSKENSLSVKEKPEESITLKKSGEIVLDLVIFCKSSGSR